MRTPTVYRRLVPVGGLLLCALVLLLSVGCVSRYTHQVSAYQNGRKLGEWCVIDLTNPLEPERRTTVGKRLRIIPADGVFLDGVWYRAGGVVIVSERNF